MINNPLSDFRFHLPPDFPTEADIEDMHRIRRKLDARRMVKEVVDRNGFQEIAPTQEQILAAVAELEILWPKLESPPPNEGDVPPSPSF